MCLGYVTVCSRSVQAFPAVWVRSVFYIFGLQYLWAIERRSIRGMQPGTASA